MPKADYQLRYAVLGMLGTFWSRQVDAETRDGARAITSLMANASGLQRMDTVVNKLLSQRRVLVENVSVGYMEGDIAFIGPDLFDFWRGALGLAADATIRLARLEDRDLVFPGPGIPHGVFEVSVGGPGDFPGTEPLHLVPIPLDLVPITIATTDKERVLVSGVDFEARRGFIVMREAPGTLFPPGNMLVLSASRELGAPYNYTTHVDGRPYGNKFVTTYQRTSQSKVAFERAAAEAAGMLVLPMEDNVVRREPLVGATRYVFANMGVIDVPYPHNLLGQGTTYPAGYIVTDAFSVTEAGDAGQEWLAKAIAGSVCSLDGALPTKGLSLPPYKTYVDWVELGPGNKPHARLHLIGTSEALQELWDTQKEHELRTGLYLSERIGLTADTASVFIDFSSIVAAYYGRRLLLVRRGMSGADAGYRDRLDEFIRREKPLGCVVLTVD